MRRGLGVTLAVGMLAVPATAGASDAAIRRVIVRQAVIIQRDEAAGQRALAAFTLGGPPSAVAVALRHERRDLLTFRRRLAGARASSGRVARGTRLVEKGLGLLVRADSGVARLYAGSTKTRAQILAQSRRAQTQVARGRADLRRGLTLIG